MGLDSAEEETGAEQATVSDKPVTSQVPQKRFRGVTKHRRSGRSVSCAAITYLDDMQHACVAVAWHSMHLLTTWRYTWKLQLVLYW